MKRYSNLTFLLISLFSIISIPSCIIIINESGDKKKTIKEEQVKIIDTEFEEKETINIGVVTWGGYIGGQYWNKGFKANKASNFYKDYGLKVEFKVLDEFSTSRNAFDAGEIDLLWCTVDAFPIEVNGLSEFESQFLFIVDYSRGGDAIVVKKGIKNYSDLKGKKIAVAPMTPSHTLLLWTLEQANLTTDDVIIIEVPSAIDATTAFRGGAVDAAVVWSPDDQDCIEKVNGATILMTSKDAPYLISDGFIAKKEFIEKHKKQLQQLYDGWMKSVAIINHSEKAKKEAAKILAEDLSLPEYSAYHMIKNVRLANHGDNMQFFGLDTDKNNFSGEKTYYEMIKKFQKLGYIGEDIPRWSTVSNSILVENSILKPTDKQAAEQ
jgi:NitT/TauT family transport system substrate-binding protein